MPPLSMSARDASEDITEDKNGGVRKILVTKGNGLKPLFGDKVYIRYVGFLENGNPFTSNRNHGDNLFTFTIGKGEVIKAWEVALPTMQQNEKCVLHCHHSYAYGLTGLTPSIRPNTNCLFEIELVQFEGEDVSKKKDGGVRKSIIQPGIGDEHPCEGCHCTVSYECLLWGEEEVLESRSALNITIGDLDLVPKGVEVALCKMREDEKARVVVQARLAYGTKGHPDLNIPPGACLLYLIHLHHFTNVKQHWEMSRPELLQQATLQKLRGGAFFKEGKVYQARKRYSRALLLVEGIHLRKHELSFLTHPPPLSSPSHPPPLSSPSHPPPPLSSPSLPSPLSSHTHHHANNDTNNISENNSSIGINNSNNNNNHHHNYNNTIDDACNNNERLSTTSKEATDVCNASSNVKEGGGDGGGGFQDNNDGDGGGGCQDNINAMDPLQLYRRKEELRLQCLLNISACHLRMRKYLRAFDTADQALQLQPNNLKGLYRRGMAHFHMANYKEARDDFQSLLLLDPSNRACARQERLCHKALQRLREKDKEVFHGMFHKFALFDLQKGCEKDSGSRKDVFSEIGEWQNCMADGMMTLEQEMEAFGESMPQCTDQHSDDE